ncbi:PA14 domain-containing protein [Neobacillus sp. 3P2-tot-E-2]|uniref:PA14 domain-containing protein n=1 Tax=Neobacillus sp. 3P2-tot-E-2 TaxID=3132212 RepID=UPI0039A3D9AD
MRRIVFLLFSLLLVGVGFNLGGSLGQAVEIETPSVHYATHVQDIGWQDPVSDGDISGTEGKAKRLESIKISVGNVQDLGVKYSTHVQDVGWLNYVSDGRESGTTGKGKRLEAIKIELTGTQAENYDIYYRVHAENYGWMDWVKNGELAGTSGEAKRLEAIEIVIKPKEQPANIDPDRPSVVYATHVQNYGWLDPVANGLISGTEGQALRVEAINIKLQNSSYTGGITYSTHVQYDGWQKSVSNGGISGTVGPGKRLEAIKISLTGDIANYYDIYYRVHSQNYGWMDWMKNGKVAGTEGLGLRIEAIQIVLVKKGGEAPDSSYKPTYKPKTKDPVHYNWGTGSPAKGFPVDNFLAEFDQSGYFTNGDYFVQAFADDGVSVNVDGVSLINRMSSYTSTIDRALWLGVKEGNYSVYTKYLELSNGAGVFSDVVPFDSWLAYYYQSENMSGMPADARIVSPSGDLKMLSEDFGTTSPVAGVGPAHFSARYTTAKHITPGTYILRAKADDGIRIYLDGKLVVDRWKNSGYRDDSIKLDISNRTDAKEGEQDVHWIEVQYYNATDTGKVEVGIEPFQDAIVNSWVGEVYPTNNFQGTPYVLGGINSINPLTKLDFNWGTGSPHSAVSSNRFSARFTKKLNLDAGTYIFSARADDGVRVKIDDETIINAWPNTGYGTQRKIINLTGSNHIITVEYYEDTADAYLSFDYQRLEQLPVLTGKTVHYNWGSGGIGVGQPSDYFLAEFDQSGTYEGGDYFLQAVADDGVKVEVDGKTLINRWSGNTAAVDRALWLGVNGGQHKVKTHYYEDIGDAGLFSDIVPFDSWLAYYYPNENVSGMPANARIVSPTGDLKMLSEDFGTTSPVAGVGPAHFSARYTTAKHITPGTYILRAKADDGIRVYLDGKLVVDRWTNSGYREDSIKLDISNRTDAQAGEQDVHWIEVQYYNATDIGKVEVAVEPFEGAIVNNWIEEIYPNQDLMGTPFIYGGKNGLTQITDLNYNWTNNMPHPSVTGQNFSTRFTKKMTFEAGTYLFEAKADDGVRVLVDNQPIINNWANVGTSRNAIYLNAGEHTITVEYNQKLSDAYLVFNIQKLSSNRVLYQQGRDVQYNWGTGGPASFSTDSFEAYFDQSGNYSAGDYFIQSFADDSVKVDVDGQSLIDRWTNYTAKADRALWLNVSNGYHSVMTHYFENINEAAVYSHIVPFDTWLAYYYPNESLSGIPVAAKTLAPVGTNKSLIEDFQTNSPAPSVPNDHFSARYTTAKRINPGTYLFRAKQDDGVRVYLDGKLIIDSWSNGGVREEYARISVTNRTDLAPGQENVHWIEVEYYDSESVGSIEFSVEPLVGPVYLTSYYNYSLSQVVDAQMKVTPQTDLYTKYVREDALTKNEKGEWIVNGTWNVRGGPGTNYPIVGTINNGVKVLIKNTITTPGQPTWYQISAWINALRGDVENYVNPNNYSESSNEYFQFLKLSESTGLNVNEVNSKILSGNGILQDKASSFIEAGTRLGINEVYLISHALLETGNGTSPLSTGILVSSVDGKAVEPKVVYNMYGIKATDACPDRCGSEYAYKMGWTAPELAIVGGAEFIANNYIKVGQDTLYKMRWNPASPGTHQYATDIGWAVKQVNRIKSLYDLLSKYNLVFDEPKFQ